MSVFFGTKGGTYGSIRIFESDHETVSSFV